MPRAEPKDAMERKLERLEERNPELARKVEEKAIEKEFEKESSPEFITQEERQPQLAEQPQYFRRRQFRAQRRGR